MFQWETIFKGIKKYGLCRQVVFLYRWSLKQVWLYYKTHGFIKSRKMFCFFPLCRSLLQDRTDGIEVSYNAAGALAHMASDGEDVWRASTSRGDVLNKMADAIESWQLDEQRNINYRSVQNINNSKSFLFLNIKYNIRLYIFGITVLAFLTPGLKKK